MKKTCNGCKASSRGHYSEYICDLGYKMESVFSKDKGFYLGGKPLENCPKPKTYGDYLKEKGYK